jgi:hypothetical protein
VITKIRNYRRGPFSFVAITHVITIVIGRFDTPNAHPTVTSAGCYEMV